MSRPRYPRFEMDEPFRVYSLNNSTSLPSPMIKLIQETAKLPYGGMMGRPEVLSLNMIMMRSMRAVKVLDVGVFTGLSALAAAICIPENGKVVACDVSDHYIPLGRKYWREAGVEHKIDVRINPAAVSLRGLLATPGEEGTFDFAFIDADKNSYLEYYELTLKLLRPGGVIAFDNVLWGGSVVEATRNPASADHATATLVTLNSNLSNDPRVTTSLVNIGDGLLLAYKN